MNRIHPHLMSSRMFCEACPFEGVFMFSEESWDITNFNSGQQVV